MIRFTVQRAWSSMPTFAGQDSEFALTDPVRIPEGTKVPPGKVYTFRVRFRRAPNEPRRVPSWWRMQVEHSGPVDRLDSVGPQLFGQTARIAVPRVCP